jgi:hypothetical protein
MVGLALTVIGAIIALVGAIWFLIVAFSENVLWGLGCLCVPLVSLVFLVMHLEKAGKPFLIQVGGIVLYFLGSVVSGQR